MHGLEFQQPDSFLKSGLYYADHITAVSPTYAREITEPQFAYGMEELRQAPARGATIGDPERRGCGYLEPGEATCCWRRVDRDALKTKAENKRQLQIAMGLKVDDKARCSPWSAV